MKIQGQSRGVSLLMPLLNLAVVGVVLFGCAAQKSSARGFASPADDQATSLVGQWSGKTMDDGTLTVNIGDDGKLSYSYSGGDKEKGRGAYKVSGNLILFTPEGETDAEKWKFSFDSKGRMTLEVEEEKESDREQVVMTRVEKP